ncbi:hypothetical protein KUTeg_017087 [Tegillarca granosa]|uniref:DNA primase large subunit n=1 Tax=Tegillarca granosa TaxID=220873 RepID=A0ABQ9ERH7_TEGGR|nr:hypothetical protein KUTeg_017087 [Tegillarca granosa]
MEIITKSKARRNRHNIKKEQDTLSHPLQFYKIPPSDTISLQKFEEYAIERLKVLKAVENAGVKFIKGTQNYKDHLEKEIRKTHFKGILRVPFIEVLDLVRSRKVYLVDGYAFVPRDDMISILLTHYRAHLSHSLAITCRALPHLEEDDRLLPMLCGLSKRYIGEDYGNKKSTVGEITADMIDMLSKQSFPLCMQQLHQSLRQNHHLRHGGRQQYGLFLKGIGLSLEEALKFWKNEFTKAIDGDKFDKQYSYNIRHNYGKEGKRADYTPYSCVKIIMSNPPGPGDFHGCPFKHTDPDLLAQKLRSMSLSKDAVDSVVNYAKEGHYQVACQHYFAVTHSNFEDDININHPNGYFEESRRFLNPDKGNMNKSQLGTPRTNRNPVKMEGTPISQLASQTQPSQDSTVGDFDDMGDNDLMDIAMETDAESDKKSS